MATVAICNYIEYTNMIVVSIALISENWEEKFYSINVICGKCILVNSYLFFSIK